MGAETAYGASETHIRVGQYFWITIQSNRVMTYFRQAYFHQHTSMTPSVVNKLFEHRVEKVDVDALKANILKQDNILTKQGKYTKQMKSTLDFSG